MIAKSSPIRALLFIIFLDQTYLTITFPLITLIFFDPHSRLFLPETSYAARSMWYGLCISLPNLINLFFAPLLSTLSDEWGRKKILIIEVFSACLFTFIVGLGIYFGALLLVLLGFVIKGAFVRANPTALAIIGDTVLPHQKIIYMGYLQFAISVGAAIGPFLGGYFAIRYAFPTLNFALPFFVGASLAAINTLIVIRKMPETNVSRQSFKASKDRFAAFKAVLTHPGILQISLLLLLIQASWSTYYQFIPPLLKTRYHFNSAELGEFIGMIAFWLALTTGLGLKILHRFCSIRLMLFLATTLVSLGILFTLGICLWHGPKLLIWLSAFPVAAGDVIAYTCLTALYSNIIPAEKQGKVMGVGFVVVSATWAFTGFFGGLLLSIHPLLPLAIAPCFAISAFLLLHANFGKNLLPSTIQSTMN
ncbi:MAG: MFS transporter [Gammaproteobacteria bacterium]|nr:MFS transporter [Gammaproteobacteria bacterium]